MAAIKRSPLAPARFPRLPEIAGLELATLAGGLRYKGRADLFLAHMPKGAAVAGVFTRSSMPGAPVQWCRDVLGQGRARAILVNAGNANVFTGQAGLDTAAGAARALGRLLKCRADQVFLASTGVIGEAMDQDRLLACLPRLTARLGKAGWKQAATAIGTTDTYPKAASQTVDIDGVPVRIAGIAKGSGMIAPDMATMLGFLFTDARLPAPVLQKALQAACATSFNAITVDSDTSTSDTVLLCATGAGPRHARIERVGDPRLKAFRAGLEAVMRDLAHQIVRDGEGASKFIAVTVTGAENNRAARNIGLSIANSPLVKTAIAGQDANWGRIVMAVGKSGEKADRDRLGIRIGGVLVAEHGYAAASYHEADVMPHMRGEEIDIVVDVGLGRGRATVWTCDLTHDYIAINADYRS